MTGPQWLIYMRDHHKDEQSNKIAKAKSLKEAIQMVEQAKAKKVAE